MVQETCKQLKGGFFPLLFPSALRVGLMISFLNMLLALIIMSLVVKNVYCKTDSQQHCLKMLQVAAKD